MRIRSEWWVIAVAVCGVAGVEAGDHPGKLHVHGGKKGKILPVAFGPELRSPGEETVVPRIARGGSPALMLSPALGGAPGEAPAPVPGILPQPPMPAHSDGGSPGGTFVNPIPEPVPIESYQGYSVSLLYPNVRYKDKKNIPACAVPMIVAVPHPCKECCCAYVQICVPPNCCPKISRKKNGYEVEYDYGSFEVEIKSKDGLITVDYDD